MDPTTRLLNLNPTGQQQQQQQQQQPAPAPQQQQQLQQQQQQPAPAPGGVSFPPAAFLAPVAGLEGYDMSSLDQLHAHALQLSASARLTNLLLPNGNGQQHNLQQGQQQQQQQQNKALQHQQPFIFLQPAPAGAQGLHPALASFGAAQPAPASQQQHQGSNNLNNNNINASSGLQPQSFFLAGAPGGTFAPAALSQQLFAAASAGGPATLTLGPNGTLQPQQQSYSSAGIPIPLPMLIPQQQPQQQQPQQPQLQPLQPAPPSSSTAASGDSSNNNNNKSNGVANGLVGNKRVHDSSVVSSSTMSVDSGGCGVGGMSMNMNDYPEFQLRNKDGSIITEKDLEKMTPAERRRYERNLREQQRSFRISQQIQQLRDVLAESKVPFKPNKFSILVSVADYIKQLQTRAIMLDTEHKKLFKTIQETNELVASGQVPPPDGSVASTSNNGASATTSTTGTGPNGTNITNDQGGMLFVQGLDYQAVFEQTPTANGVASIDGRILACNKELENILECPREQIERQSLFTLVQNHQEIFEAMAELLKRADALSNGSLKADPVQLLYWSGRVVTPDEKKLGMNITLACTKEGSPKFFSFCVSSVS